MFRIMAGDVSGSGFTGHHGPGRPAICDLRRHLWARSTTASHPTYVPRAEDRDSEELDCQLWEAVPFGPSHGLTCGMGCPGVTERDPLHLG